DGTQAPLVHIMLLQSVPVMHTLPRSQGEQSGPPQSTSVSLPFLTPSLHDDAAHIRLVQNPLWQSLPWRHILWASHGMHEPPQSISVSSPSFARSMQPIWNTGMVMSCTSEGPIGWLVQPPIVAIRLMPRLNKRRM